MVQPRAYPSIVRPPSPNTRYPAASICILRPIAATERYSSFLPAFPGAHPYHHAHHRGVKIIGATAHYVTAELDEGPIIEQDIVRVSHRGEVEDLIRKGKDLERVVLARAVRYHLENRVLVYGNKTAVFA